MAGGSTLLRRTRVTTSDPGQGITDLSPDGRWLAMDKKVSGRWEDIVLIHLDGERPRFACARSKIRETGPPPVSSTIV